MSTRPPVDIVVVGAATRDVTENDPRGWRLGGAGPFAALTIARLGLRVIAMLGVDAQAADASEIEVLRGAGVELRLLPLERGPVFENVETPTGRVQRVLGPCDELPGPSAVDREELAAAGAWFLGPVADELTSAWLDALPDGVPIAVGWQGLLRTFQSDGTVARREPSATELLRRATLVGVSRDDLAPSTDLRALAALLEPAATLVVTHGADGGLALDPTDAAGHRRIRRFDAIPPRRIVDVTGAGDVFLAALFAARVEPRLIGGRTAAGYDLLLAAAAASLAVEDHGLAGVPTRSAIRNRMRDGLALVAARRNRDS